MQVCTCGGEAEERQAAVWGQEGVSIHAGGEAGGTVGVLQGFCAAHPPLSWSPGGVLPAGGLTSSQGMLLVGVGGSAPALELVGATSCVGPAQTVRCTCCNLM